MRDLVLKQIEDYRDAEQGFSPNTMRWSSFYFIRDHGIEHFSSRKSANRSNTGAIHLSETTADDLATLTDSQLLNVLIGLTRQRQKQM